MKNILTLILFIIGFSANISAQNTSTLSSKEYNKNVFLQHKNTISFSPINIALSQGIISYERKFENKNSFVFQNSFQMFNNTKTPTLRSYKSLKFYSEVQYRRYLTYFQLRKNKFPDTKNAFGVYVAPLFNYEYGEQHYKSLESEIYGTGKYDYAEKKFFNSVQAGVLAGINFDIIYGKLSAQLNVGAAYKKSWVVYNQTQQGVETYQYMKPGIMAYAYTGFIPKINFQIGYNF